VYFSPRWKSILGYGPDEIIDDFSEWETRLHPEDRERAIAVVRDYLDGRSGEYELEHRLRHKDGSYRWILARGAAVFDAQGHACRMVGSHLDITERRNAEERLHENEAQMLAAQHIQERLLPQSSPKIPGLDIAGSCLPAEYAAGDYFDFLLLPDGSVVLVIADVMGHGIGPALVMATTSSYMRSLASVDLPLAEVVTRTNAMLFGQTDGNLFVTSLLCRIDPATSTLQYVNAGHSLGLVINSTGNIKTTFDAGHLPLGMLPDVEYVNGECIDLAIGDYIVLLTDGLIEARGSDGELFGIQRVIDLVRGHGNRSADKLIQSLHGEVNRFTGDASLKDDLTLVAAKIQKLPIPTI
jgi:phosphoserine phosphatase RsbU/P